MKKTNPTNKTKGLFGIFATLALAIGIGVSIAPREVVETKAAQVSAVALTFPDDNSNNNKVSGYTGTKTYKIGTYEWAITNFNNNSWNSSWSYIRAGAKNATATATISTSKSISAAISKIEVTIDSVTSAVTSTSLTVASNVGFSTGVQTIAGPTIETGTMTYNIPTPSENQFYKLAYNITNNTGTNGIMQISKVQYFYDDAPPRTLTDITISGTPATQYIGEEFDATGLTFIAEYDDLTSDTLDAEDLIFSPAVIAADTTEISVSKGSFTSSNKINGFSVLPLTLEEIAVTSQPTKKTYFDGEELDKTGMVVIATYNSGKTVNVTSSVVVTPSILRAGTTSVLLTYEGKTTTVTGLTVTLEPETFVEKFGNNFSTPLWQKSSAGDGSDYIGFQANTHYVQTNIETILGGSQFVLNSDITFKFKVGSFGGSISTSPTLSVELIGGGTVLASGTGQATINNSTESYGQGPEITITKPENVKLISSVKISVIDKGSLSSSVYMRFQEISITFFKLNAYYEDALTFATWMMDEVRDDESCVDKFDEAQSKWDGLSSGAKEMFITNEEFVDAKDRLEQWALANGLMGIEELDNSGSGSKNTLQSNNSNAVTLTVLIGVIGITALVGYYFLKKKQQA